MSDKQQKTEQAEGPSLAYGPNPAVSAQPGVDAAADGSQYPEYPEATGEQAVPVSDHGTMAEQSRRLAGDRAEAEKHLAKADPAKEGTVDAGGVKLGASGAETLVNTPSPAADADGGADDPERHAAGRPSSGPVRQTSAGGPPDESDVPDGGRQPAADKPTGTAKPRGGGPGGKAR
jgi:hypothetical protein